MLIRSTAVSRSAVYSIPEHYRGQTLLARADGGLVKMFHHGRLVKTHPRQPPVGRGTDPGDLPAEKTAYAMRDLTRPSPRPTLS